MFASPQEAAEGKYFSYLLAHRQGFVGKWWVFVGKEKERDAVHTVQKMRRRRASSPRWQLATAAALAQHHEQPIGSICFI